ncbi:glycosyltransferase family 1 protein [Colwellia sp. E2M01]|uniref:glycosyltransferase family 4 protein n=1 Tax=Colwellia sp. E2M01 TaxID=2841561 RepID=UPI001C0855F2|nr:glycosyltransferase family 1 protein [Colwellia sp. E2M01]MBU2870032.1 glycosyltransferase family 4 protein [Colwellia sp. E2M01]
MKKNILINHLLEPGNKISGISNYLFYVLNSLLDLDEFNYILVTCWEEENLPKMLRNKGLKIITLPYIESMPKNIIKQLIIIPKLIKEHQISLEFNPDPVGCFLGKTPLVAVTHDLYFDVSPASYKFHHRLWWKIFYPRMLKRAKKFICVSNNTQNDLIKFYPWVKNKLAVVQEAACLSGTYQEQERKKTGLFVANVSPNKGARVLIEAMGILQAKGKDYPVEHIGRDSVGYFEQFAQELNVAVTPIKLGYLSESDLATKYSQARFLAFPSLYEGFGLPVLEAQKFALPVIASNIPVLQEVGGEGAVYIELEDANALANYMEKLIEDDDYFSKISSLAITNEAKFTWHKAAIETQQIFNDILQNERQA